MAVIQEKLQNMNIRILTVFTIFTGLFSARRQGQNSLAALERSRKNIWSTISPPFTTTLRQLSVFDTLRAVARAQKRIYEHGLNQETILPNTNRHNLSMQRMQQLRVYPDVSQQETSLHGYVDPSWDYLRGTPTKSNIFIINPTTAANFKSLPVDIPNQKQIQVLHVQDNHLHVKSNQERAAIDMQSPKHNNKYTKTKKRLHILSDGSVVDFGLNNEERVIDKPTHLTNNMRERNVDQSTTSSSLDLDMFFEVHNNVGLPEHLGQTTHPSMQETNKMTNNQDKSMSLSNLSLNVFVGQSINSRTSTNTSHVPLQNMKEITQKNYKIGVPVLVPTDESGAIPIIENSQNNKFSLNNQISMKNVSLLEPLHTKFQHDFSSKWKEIMKVKAATTEVAVRTTASSISTTTSRTTTSSTTIAPLAAIITPPTTTTIKIPTQKPTEGNWLKQDGEPINITYLNDNHVCPTTRARWQDFTVYLETKSRLCMIQITFSARYKQELIYQNDNWWGSNEQYVYTTVFDPEIKFVDLHRWPGSNWKG